MRKLKNILYITSPDAYIMCEGEALKIRIGKDKEIKLPAHNLEGLVQFGYPGVSPRAMALCAKLGISITFLSQHGKFLARVEGPQSGNILLRREQYRIYDQYEKSLLISKSMIAAKIINSNLILKRGIRDYSDRMNIDFERAIEKLDQMPESIINCDSEDVLRGIEGDAAREYFGKFSNLIFVDKSEFYFNGRNKRPPLDKMNCLLSFLYTLLVHECKSACETVGLDPSAGFMHKDRPGRPSLALDLMEELRPVFADRLALTLVNRRQIKPEHFEHLPQGDIRITEDGKKVVLEAWQARKNDLITHHYIGEKIEFGLIPYVQALLLSRHIRGDIAEYPAYIWR